MNLGLVALLRGKTPVAHTRYREALLISGAHGEDVLTHCALMGIALCGGRTGPDAVTAIRLHGVIDRFVEVRPNALDPVELRLRSEDLAARRREDDGSGIDAILEQGHRLSVSEAVDLALSVTPL